MIDNYIDIDSDTLKKFCIIHELQQTSVHNVTAIKDKESFFKKHVLDSLYVFYIKNIKFQTVMDVGSGGGFPGLAVALVRPEATVYLVESKSKKCSFLNMAIQELHLDNVKVINERVENLIEPKCDVILSRGVGKIRNIIKWSINVSHETTKWIFYKGEDVVKEIEESKKLLKKYRMEHKNVRIEKPIKRTYTFINRP